MTRAQFERYNWFRSGRSRSIMGYGIGLVVIVVSAGLLGGLHWFSRTPGTNQVTDVSNTISVTASELAEKYRRDQSAGDHKYSGRLILLNGIVLWIVIRPSGWSEVGMEGGTTAEISPKSRVLIGGISKGEHLSVVCQDVRIKNGRPDAVNCLFHDAELIK